MLPLFEKICVVALIVGNTISIDITSTSDQCTPKKSLKTCEICLKSEQCKVGYCCPSIKHCILGKETWCHPPNADCQPPCYDHQKVNACSCNHSDFPNNWAQPTCKENTTGNSGWRVQEWGFTRKQHIFRKDECKTRYQCCCRNKGVDKKCWHLCTDTSPDKYSEDKTSTSLCKTWNKVISECIYCTAIVEDPLEKCCREKGVPDVCFGYCETERADQQRKGMHTGTCEKWFEQIGKCREDSKGAIARSKRSPSEDENGFAPPPAPYLPRYSSPIYPTKSDKLFTNKAILMEAISGKRRREKITSSNNSGLSSTECQSPRQCCCREKGVIDVCWGYCLDIKEYSSRSFAVLGICEKWMSLINYCIYCYKPDKPPTTESGGMKTSLSPGITIRDETPPTQYVMCPTCPPQCPNWPHCAVDCDWSAWAHWTSCSSTCGPGTRTRIRDKMVKEINGGICNGNFMQDEPCTNKPCPEPCKWGNWAEWSICSKSCGSGMQNRKREKETKEKHGGSCEGDSKEDIVCNTQACPQACQWGKWGSWNSCSKTCGDGKKARNRKKTVVEKNGGKCNGNSNEEDNCNTNNCPEPCKWTGWREWGTCSKSCGGGKRVRKRDKEIKEKYGGSCNGGFSDESTCNTRLCPQPCQWGQWGIWKECSKTCGEGIRVRNREKLEKESNGGKCSGSSNEEDECNVRMCPEPCKLGEWMEWKPCSRTCGNGERIRIRNKEVVEKHGGICLGALSEREGCNPHACPQPCVLCSWNKWSECSKTCGTGKRLRFRKKEVKETNGGKCDDPLNEEENCNITHCPEPCTLGEWTEWGSCSKSCGKGDRIRTREKQSDEKHGGTCPGALVNKETCSPQACPHPCKVGTWNSWSECSKSCGTGKTTRTREKEVEETNGGKCEDSLKEEMFCSKQPCPPKCHWEEWGQWKDCDEPCPWTEWSEWKECSRTCGKGKRIRNRLRELECIDFSEQIESCNLQSCPGNREEPTTKSPTIASTKENSLESCCEEKMVPRKCLGICMGDCKSTPWETYRLIDPDNRCKKYEKLAMECCKDELGTKTSTTTLPTYPMCPTCPTQCPNWPFCFIDAKPLTTHKSLEISSSTKYNCPNCPTQCPNWPNCYKDMEDCCTDRKVIRICIGICMGSCKLSSRPAGPFNPVCGWYEDISMECCRLLHPSNSTFQENSRGVAGRSMT